MSMAAQKKNLLILFFVFRNNEILWCLRNKDIFKGFHFASGITCKGFRCMPAVPTLFSCPSVDRNKTFSSAPSVAHIGATLRR